MPFNTSPTLFMTPQADPQELICRMTIANAKILFMFLLCFSFDILNQQSVVQSLSGKPYDKRL